MQNNACDALVQIAKTEDIESIFAVMKVCADEIPVRMDGGEREKRLRSSIRHGCLNGRSFVDVCDNQIVGFLLVSSGLDKGYFELDYGGVLPEYRGIGLFGRMLGEVKARSGCLDATVKNANKSGMADKLLKLGFIETGLTHAHDERAFRWVRPGPDAIETFG